jgi:hypothetical protein
LTKKLLKTSGKSKKEGFITQRSPSDFSLRGKIFNELETSMPR